MGAAALALHRPVSETAADPHALALTRFRLASEFFSPQRKREKEDLAFQVPQNQWTAEARKNRGAAIVNGVNIPERPMLSIPSLDQPIQLVLNQERAAQLGVNIHPIDEHAEEETADVLQGLYRRIEVDSRANLARSWAFEYAVKGGLGAYRILTEYAPDAEDTRDQNVVIKRILYQESVYFDPTAEEPDWSDGRWAFITRWMPYEAYCAKYGDSDLASETSFDGLVSDEEDEPAWVRNDEAGKAVLVAEYWAVEGEGTARRVIRRVINGAEVLETKAWAGQYIPIVPVIGRELLPVQGKRIWMGIIGPNKDAVRLVNYSASALVEAGSLEPKAGFDVDPEEIEGYEAWWNELSIRNFPYLPRHKFLHGQVLPPPQRLQADTSKMQINVMLLQQGNQLLHTGTGAFEPSLGQASPSAKTKGGTLALQAQHDQGNSNWLDNLAEISLVYEAKVVLDLLPHIYDRPGRIARILDKEDNASVVMLNQPFTMGAKKRPVAVPLGMGIGAPDPATVKHYDLNKGRYGVTVSIGKAYKSRVEEGSDRLGAVLQADPALMPILGPEWMKFQDWPGHDKAYDILKKMREHQFPWLADANEQPDAMQQLQKAGAENQQLKQQLQQAAEIIKGEQVKHQAMLAKAKMDNQTAVTLQAMKDATTIAAAQINASTKVQLMASEAQNEAQATGREHAFAASEAHKAQAHDLAMAATEHQQALATAQQQHEQALQQAEQGGAIDSTLADQGHQQGLEAAQQQAALQPPPAEGASA